MLYCLHLDPPQRPTEKASFLVSGKFTICFPSLQHEERDIRMSRFYESQWSVYWRMCHACMERSVWEQYTVLNTAEISPPSHGVKYSWLPTLPSASQAHWQRRQDSGPTEFPGVVDCSIS